MHEIAFCNVFMIAVRKWIRYVDACKSGDEGTTWTADNKTFQDAIRDRK
jgi:hypothetical protein